MDPYTNALNYLHDLDLGPETAPPNDFDTTFVPDAWSQAGAQLVHSNQPWPFVFLVRESSFYLPGQILTILFNK